jgi:hypothetical protein
MFCKFSECELQGVSSDQVLQMPITGLPSNSCGGMPLFFIPCTINEAVLSPAAKPAGASKFLSFHIYVKSCFKISRDVLKNNIQFVLLIESKADNSFIIYFHLINGLIESWRPALKLLKFQFLQSRFNSNSSVIDINISFHML